MQGLPPLAGALGLAAKYPDLVKRLVLEEGVPLGHTPAMDELVNGLIANISGPGFEDAMRGIYPNFFHPNADKACVSMCAADAARKEAAFESRSTGRS